MKTIAKIYTAFKEKFGIPRQSGLCESIGKIIFEPEFNRTEAVRGLEGYSHLWLIWNFSEAERDTWSPTVRPPRLGGNRRVGVFASRSPFRPNPIGLSCVRLLSVDIENGNVTLTVEGADILSGTPIYDIKPYLPYTDSHPDAVGGFADGVLGYKLEVSFPENLKARLKSEDCGAIVSILENDPRPSYQDSPEREYGFRYSDYEIKFKVNSGVITVTDIILL